MLTVLQSIQSLLADPNNDSPLNTHAARLWVENMGEYNAQVKQAHASSGTSN